MNIYKNAVYRMLLNGVNLLIPIFTGMYIARIFDMDSYGAFNLASSEVAFFLIFGTFGIYNYGIREIGRIQDDAKEREIIFTNLFVFGVITNLLTILAYVIYILYFIHEYQIIYFILITNIIANLFNVEWMNEGLESYRFITIKTVVIRLVYVIALFAFVKRSSDVPLYALFLGLSNIVNNIISFIRIKAKHHFHWRKLDLKKYIFPLFVLTIIVNINYLYTQFDRVLLGKYLGGEAINFYYIPSYIVTTIFTLISSILAVSIPKLSYYSEHGENHDFQKLLLTTTDTYFFMAIPIFMGIACLAEEVMILYGGINYAGAAAVLLITCFYKIVTSYEYIFGHQIIYIKNRQNFLMMVLFIGGVMNVALNYLLLVNGMLSPETSIFKSLLLEVAIVSILSVYVKRYLNVRFSILNKNKILYLLLGMLFFPIKYIVFSVLPGMLLPLSLTIFICIVLYIGGLAIMKDEILLGFLKKIKKDDMR